MNSPITMKPGGSQELEEPAVNYPQGPARTMLERLCETLVLNAFEKMSFGKLQLSLPDGSRHELGDPSSEVSATLQVKHTAFFRKCVLYGDVGFGEAYVEGDWETDDIQALIAWFILNVDTSPTMSGSSSGKPWINFLASLNRLYHLLRPNSLQTSRSNIREHYDLGNSFYGLFLDPSMTYSAGLFQSPETTLEEAQEMKYARLCEQLRLQPGDRVLEIGCGWGGFCCYAARRYGCHVTAATISEAQLEYTRERVAREGLQDQVEVVLCDYRHLKGRFDKIASIEMMEAVGHQYMDTFCAQCDRLLKKDGLLCLQMITTPDSRYKSLRKGVDWIQKHIFPGSLLLSMGRVNHLLNRKGNFDLSDLKDMGPSYARTLHLWRERFNARHEDLHRLGFDARFIRKWNYYFSYCEAAFAGRNISVVQALYTRPNNRSLT